jgi:hypothetical protein
MLHLRYHEAKILALLQYFLVEYLVEFLKLHHQGITVAALFWNHEAYMHILGQL